MAVGRHRLIDPSKPGIYHTWNRCVRRAFLCGDGYEHRKDWIQKRLRELAGLFALDVCGYAVMANHLHVILRTDPERPRSLTDPEVARRYVTLFPWTCGLGAGTASSAEDAFQDAVDRLIDSPGDLEIARERLGSVSWFWSKVAEPIARRANREDRCTGRFWEERFKSKELLDDGAILSGLVYVDLNPIRAGAAETPEASDYTSVQDRIKVREHFKRSRKARWRGGQPRSSRGSARRTCTLSQLLPNIGPKAQLRHAEDGIWLAPIAARVRVGSSSQDSRSSSAETGKPTQRRGLLDMTLDEYLDFVDTLGRRVVRNKRGSIHSNLAPILERLDLDPDRWQEAMTKTAKLFGSAIGSASSLAAAAKRRGTKWAVGALPVYRSADPT